jgi:hypothetical protein
MSPYETKAERDDRIANVISASLLVLTISLLFAVMFL